ncbi:26S proteasome non-ATPase regulatory subunit 9, partial [Biomphalaria glabrata]
DYIAMWQRNSIQFIQEQQQKMLGMAMCPFLFGVTLNLPEAWIKLLYNNGIVERD